MLRCALPRAQAAVLLAVGMLWAMAGPALARGPEPVADIAAPLLESVVNISTAQRVSGSRRVPPPRVPDGSPFQDFFDEFFGNGGSGEAVPRRVQSLGSGFVIDAAGIIITNNHVIKDADEITAIFNDGTELEATLIGADDKTDIAVLRVEPEKPLVAVGFGDSEALRVGDWVMAIGNPFGLGGSVTLGIVSARNRDIKSGPYDNFIQTDAAINRGNSGGPLFDMDGQVVGINTAIISPTGGSIGIGFAVPAATAQHVIDQLMEFGETRRGWLGVRIQDVNGAIADSLGLETTRGALVAGVTPEGPAETAGIKAGDVIVDFDGVAVGSTNELTRAVADTPIGKSVDVVVLREGETTTVQVELGWLEDAERIAAAAEDEATAGAGEGSQFSAEDIVEGPFGLRLAELTPELRDHLDILHDVEGVVVADVATGSLAEERRIRPGDVIVEIGQERIATVADVDKRIAALKEEGRGSVLFLLANREGDLRFVAVRMEE